MTTKPTAQDRDMRSPITNRTLAGAAFALAVMFVVVPPMVAGGTYGHRVFDNGRLVAAARTSLVEFWTSGAGTFPPALQSAVDHWARYHALKASIAALLCGVLVVLGARIGRALVRSDGHGRRGTVGLAAAGAGVSALTLFALLLVMANVQGVIAPLSSLLSLLGPGARDGHLAATVEQLRQELARTAGSSGAPRTPALDAIVDDFARYHAALAAMAGAVAAGLAVTGWRSWRAAASAARASRMLRATGAAAIALAALMLVLGAANVSNAIAPEQGLQGFYGRQVDPPAPRACPPPAQPSPKTPACRSSSTAPAS